MKINFTNKEYQTLVEMLLVADWVIRSNEEEPTKETEPYDALRKKVLSHFKEMGMAEDFRYDPTADDYFETSGYEARAPHMQFLQVFEEASFWSQLADKLAARDFAAEIRERGDGPPSDTERLVDLFEITARYEDEFAEHGLEHVHVVTKPTARMH